MKPLKMCLVFVMAFCSAAGCSILQESGEPEVPEEENPEASAPIPTPEAMTALPRPLCGDAQPVGVYDLTVLVPPELDEPAPHQPFLDPIFGSCLVRVTDRRSDPMGEDSSTGMKNEYARVSAFNADDSRLIVYAIDGYWYLYDTASLRRLGQIPLQEEPRWDAQDPLIIYHLGESKLWSYNIATGLSQLVHDFSADFTGQPIAAVWTAHEGRPSMDTRYFGFMAEDHDWTPAAFIIYDRITDQAIIRDVRQMDGIRDDVDHVTISPKGAYFLASFDRACEHGQLGSDFHPCGLMVYDRDLQNGRGLLRIIGHYDTALDAAGREVIIFQDIDRDEIAMLDLENGAITSLFPIDFRHTPIGFHFSGLAYERPGWALISTYEGGYPQAFTWMDDQVFAVELKPDVQIIRLAHTHSKVDPQHEHDYWAEPHATVSRDFTRILFTSNWGRSGSGEVDMYLIELAQDSLP